MTDAPKSEKHGEWAEKLDAWRDRYESRGRLYKAGWLIVGTLVTIAGVIMIVTPGPALVFIPLGLAMLAMQFEWAERLMERALDHAERAADQAKETTPLQRVLIAVAILLAAAAAIWAVFYFDLPVPILNR